MLPSNIVAVDSQLTVLKRFSRVGPNDPLGSAENRRWERDYDRLFSNCIEVIEDLLRESGDIAPDSQLKLLSEPGDQVRRVDLLLAEVGPGEEFRRLVIVEDKLSTNRECRRDVLAQILEYAYRVQNSFTADELPDAVADWADDYRDDIRRGMRSGNFLLIIYGDSIDESLASLVQSYVDRLDASNLSDLVLIAMPIYSDGDTHVLVPHVAGGTERATRDLTVRVEVQTPDGVPVEVGKVRVGETPEDKLRRRRRTAVDPDTFMQGWKERCGQTAADAWQDFVERVKSAHIAGVEFGHFQGGAPFLYVSNSSIGTLSVLRLAEATPFVRDLLNKPGWESDPKAREARQRFRDALIQVPGATYGGTVKRVYAPVQAVADRHEAVVKAISDLAAELRTM